MVGCALELGRAEGIGGAVAVSATGLGVVEAAGLVGLEDADGVEIRGLEESGAASEELAALKVHDENGPNRRGLEEAHEQHRLAGPVDAFLPRCERGDFVAAQHAHVHVLHPHRQAVRLSTAAEPQQFHDVGGRQLLQEQRFKQQQTRRAFCVHHPDVPSSVHRLGHRHRSRDVVLDERGRLGPSRAQRLHDREQRLVSATVQQRPFHASTDATWWMV